jgi:teichuronic acid biosynthesis glycosyltransferase TuaG
MELVSVVIPYFRKKKYITETISSVLRQTYKNLEVVVVYDDETKVDLDFINNLKNNDSRIKIITNPLNLGAGECRNIGITNAKGSYIAFVDADDIWDEKKIELQLSYMMSNNYSFTHTSYKIINSDNKIVGHRKAKNFENYQSLLGSCDIGLSTVMIKKNIFTNDLKFPNLKTKEDFVLWLKFLKKNYKIFGINTDLTSWRKLNNSLSSSTLQKLIDGFNVYHKFMKFNFIKSLYYLIVLCANYLRK